MHPHDIPQEKPISEKAVFKALKHLSDEFHAFYSVLWQSKRGGRQGDGEADFILLDRKRGIIVIEVKGGEISINDGEWFSTGNRGMNKIKNPFQQVVDSKHALINFFKDSGLNHIPVTHAVAFPNQSDDISLSMYGPREIIWYRNDLNDVRSTVKRTFLHWNTNCHITNLEIEKICDLLAPTIYIRRKLGDVISGIGDELLALTAQQILAFRQIRQNRKVIVSGGAGTGKTILAIERSKQLCRDGFNTLLVCYNELLSSYLKSQVTGQDGLTTSSYHSLCIREIKKARLDCPLNPHQNWWENEAPEMLLTAAARNYTGFDAIVIDEAQDFSQSWMDSLSLLCNNAKDPPCYIFMDDRQDIYNRRWEVGNDYVNYVLDVNCRNTVEISSKVAAIFKEEAISLGCHGPEPVFCEVDLKHDAVDFVQSLISNLMKDEFLTASQIVVLSNDGNILNRLRATYVDDEPFTQYGKNGIICESIRRFKGLESDAIILLLSDKCSDILSKEDIYVALSRAKVSLYVAGSDSIRKMLSWKP